MPITHSPQRRFLYPNDNYKLLDHLRAACAGITGSMYIIPYTLAQYVPPTWFLASGAFRHAFHLRPPNTQRHVTPRWTAQAAYM